MTLKELIAKNEAARKKREAEAAAKKKEEKKEEAPKKGRKPKNRAYLVNEELPFETEEEKVEEEKVENTETVQASEPEEVVEF